MTGVFTARRCVSVKEEIAGWKAHEKGDDGRRLALSEKWGSSLRICDLVDLLGLVFADEYDIYRAEKAS
jgi:hypothetical protein